MDEFAKLLWDRLDRLEEKVDSLRLDRAKVFGGVLVINIILTIIFQVTLALIEGHK